jgi:hypothetical protein
MHLASSTAEQATLSLQHIFRVAGATSIPRQGIKFAVAFVLDERDVGIVRRVWDSTMVGRMVGARLAVVVVQGLPRGARCEWYIPLCRTERNGGPVFAFDEGVDSVLPDLMDKDALCIVLGQTNELAKLKSRLPRTIFQVIPSKTVLSTTLGITIPKRHASSYIFLHCPIPRSTPNASFCASATSVETS